MLIPSEALIVAADGARVALVQPDRGSQGIFDIGDKGWAGFDCAIRCR